MNNFIIEAAEKNLEFKPMQSNWLITGDIRSGVTNLLRRATVALERCKDTRVILCNYKGEFLDIGATDKCLVFEDAYNMLDMADYAIGERASGVSNKFPLYFILDDLTAVTYHNGPLIDLLHRCIRDGIQQNVCFLIGSHKDYIPVADYNVLVENCRNTITIEGDMCKISVKDDPVLYHVPNIYVPSHRLIQDW